MGTEWTKEQQAAIGLRDRNLLVSAAAGSGKTAVLVERIIQYLLQDDPPVDVDHLLVVTFTEAAASQMKERVCAAIEARLTEDPGNEHLIMQETLIHNAQITTIDSFCQSVIRDHFHDLDLDPAFRVGEEGELKLLRQEVLEEVLEENYAEGDPKFLNFVGAYGGDRSDKKIEDLILKVCDYARSDPDPQGWLTDCVRAYQVQTKEALAESPFGQRMADQIRRVLSDAEAQTLSAIKVAESAHGPATYLAALNADLEMITALENAPDQAAFSKQMAALSFVSLKANRDQSVDPEKVATVKTIRDDVKEMVGEIKSQYFYQDEAGMLSDLKTARPLVEELVRLCRDFLSRYEERKRDQNLIDFSDMEQYALQILTVKEGDQFVPSEAAREYQQQFVEIMIDEYQDSNLLQETILRSVSRIENGENNLFMVGDVKQSIYRFRLSRPELFMEKFDTYTTKESAQQRIDLHQNFRSRPEVIESVNGLFRSMMHRDLGGIEYDDRSALYPGASFAETKGDHKTEVLVVESDDRTLEARAIAGKIRELTASMTVQDEQTGVDRAVQYSDIVILVRSMQGYGDVLAKVLGEAGIPTYAGTKEGYFSAPEVALMLSYLQVLSNRKQDIPLTAVLTSPIGGLTERDLAVIRNAQKEGPFYEAVDQYRAQGADDQIRGKLKACLDQMDAFLAIVPYTPIHELLWQIFDETGYADFVAAMPDGEQRLANLNMLVAQAKSFESTSYKGLFHFVRYIEQLRKYEVDYGEADIMDEHADAVRIMTIHKSKGLEFPIVFVAGMGKRFNMQDARASIVLHNRLGVGLDAVDLETRVKSPTILKKVIQKEETLDSLGEELRILYVACTRAKEKLILTGTLSHPEKKWPSYQQGLSYGRRAKASTAWDWILPAVLSAPADAPMELSILGEDEILKQEVQTDVHLRLTREVLENWDTNRTYDSEIEENLNQQFSYTYPYADAQNQKMKYTVSELKKRVHDSEAFGEGEAEQVQGELLYEEPDVVPLIPHFMQEEQALSGAERGTAYHRILELLPFDASYDEATLQQAIDTLAETGRIDPEMAACVDARDLLAFLNTDSGHRMRKAAHNGTLHREQPFVLGLAASEIDPKAEEEQTILIQGMIDVYFEEDDAYVVLDYKTDQVQKASELVDKYHAQLDYYARALTQLTGKPVKEKIIYSFTLKEEIHL